MAKQHPQPWDAVFSQLKVWLVPDHLPLRPIDANLDAAEAKLGHRFPQSYRALIRKYGHGMVMDHVTVVPLAPTTGYRTDLFKNTAEQRWLYGDEIADSMPEPEVMRRAIYFAYDGFGGDYFWDPLGITDRRHSEYRVYWNDARSTNPQIVADSFHGFLAWIEQDVRSWREPEGPEDEEPGIKYVPRPWIEKLRPDERDVKLWLAFNHNTARDLALSIRDRGQTDAFPILADALQEAGCTNADLLDSCRTGDPDIDGAWVLQVLLGKRP